MVDKILKTIFEIMTGIGLFLVIGAVGGIEIDTLSVEAGLIEAGIGLVFMVVFEKLSELFTDEDENSLIDETDEYLYGASDD